MIEVPALELAGGDGAGQGVGEAHDAFPERPALGEDQPVDLLVQQDDEREDDEALQEEATRLATRQSIRRVRRAGARTL